MHSDVYSGPRWQRDRCADSHVHGDRIIVAGGNLAKRADPVATGRRRERVKHTSFAFLGILFFSGLNPSANPEMWRTFTSSEGGFSILMPRIPTLTAKVHDSVVGAIRENTYSLKTPSGEYTVEYSDLPRIAVYLGGQETILERAKEGFLKEEGAIVRALTPIRLGAHQGRELTYDIPATNGVGKARFYLVARRLYVLVGTSGKPSNPNIDRFLRSFRLLSS